MPVGQCVFCGHSQPTFKVLKCLHIACSSCVGRHVQPNNTLSCPVTGCETIIPSPGQGRPLAPTLPSCRLTEASSNADATVFCDECAEDVAATHVCLDCKWTMCGEHALTHPERRKHRGHRVERRKNTLVSAQSRTSPGEKCPLHMDQLLEHCCRQCHDLCCPVCLSHGAHADHKQHVQSVAEAAEAARALILETCGATTGECHGKLKKKLEGIESMKNEIKGQAEKASKEISDSFRKWMDALKEREERLLSELDRLCWEELEPLEEHTLKLSEQLSLLPGLVERSEQCVSDSDVVRIEPWLREKATEISRAAELDIESAGPCCIVCYGLPEEEAIETKLSQLGGVANCGAVNLQKSSFEVASEVFQGTSFDLCVKLCDERGEVVSTPHCNDRVRVTVSPASASPEQLSGANGMDGVTFSKLSPKVWSYKISTAGQYTLQVRCGDSDIRGSPCTIRVVPPIVFDSGHCAQGLVISEGGKKVTCPQGGSQRSVYGKPLNSGIHTFTLQFFEPDNNFGNFPLCGVTSADGRPLVGDISGNGQFIGYSSHSGTSFNGQATKGATTGSVCKWTSNALFKLRIDCDNRTFTLECQQSTGNFSTTWSNIPTSVCLRTGLYYTGSSFEIKS